MKLLMIEPFFGGSHRQFAEGLQKYSSHQIDIRSMPAENWNWRLRGAALHFSKEIHNFSDYDGIITSNMIRLADLKSYAKEHLPPVLVYFHENQLTYPLAEGEKRNPHLCMGDISTALSAEKILFNSKFHREVFIKAVSEMMKQSPDYPAGWAADEIRQKSGFIYPGVSFQTPAMEGEIFENHPPLIIWNHRWSYDKNARDFFHALSILKKNDIDFRLALLGERTAQIPVVFSEAERTFNDKLVCFGYAENREEYIRWLKQGDIVVSTAIQENFGIAVVEAMYYGCVPLLPTRLSYPEILPGEFHDDFLYTSQRNFIDKLNDVIRNIKTYKKKAELLPQHLEKYAWGNIISEYDENFGNIGLIKNRTY